MSMDVLNISRHIEKEIILEFALDTKLNTTNMRTELNWSNLVY